MNSIDCSAAAAAESVRLNAELTRVTKKFMKACEQMQQMNKKLANLADVLGELLECTPDERPAKHEWMAAGLKLQIKTVHAMKEAYAEYAKRQGAQITSLQRKLYGEQEALHFYSRQIAQEIDRTRNIPDIHSGPAENTNPLEEYADVISFSYAEEEEVTPPTSTPTTTTRSSDDDVTPHRSQHPVSYNQQHQPTQQQHVNDLFDFQRYYHHQQQQVSRQNEFYNDEEFYHLNSSDHDDEIDDPIDYDDGVQAYGMVMNPVF